MTARTFYLKAAAQVASVAFLAAAPLHAQNAHGSETAPDHRHQRGASHDEEIVVAGHPPIDFALLSSTATLEGDQLVARTRGQIGETLARLPGVSATSFAPGASRPVLRGFDGDRIRVLIDGIGSIDVSSVSADHAVVFDALTVDHIDIIHGPAVLLFGGQAIGGAVNAIDKRIPRSVPERIGLPAMATYGSAADERALAAALEAPLGNTLALQLDASWRKSNDLRIGGFVNSRRLREKLLEEAEEHRDEGEIEEAEHFEALARLKGRIPNSAARSATIGAGLAWLAAGASFGLSVQHHDSRYGVPLRPGSGHGHEHEAEGEEDHAAEAVKIDLKQTRIDMRGEIRLSGLLDSLQFRGAWGDYAHVELEDGNVGTRFASRGFEGRIDLVQAAHKGWRGRSGVQLLTRKLTARGEEAYFPNNTVDRIGLFTLQSLRIGRFELEAAGRYEHVRIASRPAAFRRSFDLWSGAVGASFRPAEGWKLGVHYIRGARAPAPEELLSNGLHVATQAYEIGDRTFRSETSNGLEAYIRHDGTRAGLSATFHLTRFGNFIAALPTDEEEDGFPVFRYAQLPARYKGLETTAWVEPLRWHDGALRLDAALDYTHARLKRVGPAPRIPPLRLRGGAEVRQGQFRLRAEVEWNEAQRRVAAFKEPVSGFTLVNLSADWHPLGEDGPLTLLLSADNLFDVSGRRAASFTRDFVPIAGRDLRLTARLVF
ncbi:MAG: TonB-dependent receptor [Novosphingobium sp.]|nr:TonB-dependent receptor [Novosphingobium sp.]